MAGPGSADLIVKVAANIQALQSDFAAAAASVKAIEGAVTTAHTASTSWAGSLNDLGHSWVLRVAEGQLLRDAVREVIGAMKEMAAFFPELAVKGAIVGDVEDAFKRLTVQAGLLGETLLTTLRSATHGTVDDLDLMKRVNENLAAGVNLTDKQFGLLAQGAFALAQATGTNVKAAFDTMNDAMLTGRTRSLALLTGKIDLTDAEKKYAESLHTTADHLTAEGKMEAARAAILQAVSGAVGRLGEQTDGLDERVQQAQVAWANFTDELGKTIAQSPVILAGLDSLKGSLATLFGPDQKQQIAGIAAVIDNIAITVVDFGIGAVATAGAVIQVWAGIKTAVLAVETAILGIVTGIGEVVLATSQIAGKLHLIDPAEVAQIKDTQVQLRAMTGELAAQTVEAGKAALGNSDLSQSLEKAGGALFVARDGMLAAQAATTGASAATAGFVGPLNDVTAGVAKLGMAVPLTAAELKTLQDLIRKTATENVILWDQWAANVVKASGTATDAQLADIKRVSDKMTAERILAGTADGDYYALRASLDKQANDAILTDHARVAKGSIEALQQEADKQRATLADMTTGSLHYTRDVLDEQVAKIHEADDAVRGYGTNSVAAHAAATAAAQKNADALANVKKAADAAAAALKNLEMGNTYDIGHAARDPEIMKLLHDGWSLENAEALNLARQWGFQAKTYDKLGNLESTPSKGERVPGYETGGPTVPGLSMLHGGEYVVPKAGALVSSGSGGGPQVINLVVDGRVLASIVNDHNTKTLKQSRQWPSA